MSKELFPSCYFTEFTALLYVGTLVLSIRLGSGRTRTVIRVSSASARTAIEFF